MSKFLVTLFLGWAGVHKFMEKKTGMGVLYLCTFGLFGIGWLIDIIISARNLKQFDVKPVSQYVNTTAQVAGTYYKKNEISSIMSGNRMYSLPNDVFIQKVEEGKRVYRFKYRRTTAFLIPEPTNPHDSNAIKVMIDNVHVGYIPSDLCSDFKRIIKKTSQLEAAIHGGDYKYHLNGKIFKNEDNFCIDLYIPL